MSARSPQPSVAAMFGLRVPLIAAPMFLVSNVALAVAVGEAGGMGAIPAHNYRTLEALREALAELRRRTTAPFAINLILLENPRFEDELALLLDERVPLVITSLGDPSRVIERAHARDVRVFCDVVGLRHAKKAEAAGADAVVAVAAGAGGHAGPISPFALFSYLREELSIPVVAAGGIATGGAVAAALALGASAAYVGTRFIATPEANVPDDYREMLLAANPEDVEYTAEVTGHPANFLKESLARFRQLEGKKTWKDAYSAGHGVGLIHDVLGAREVVSRLVKEYEEARQGLPVLG